MGWLVPALCLLTLGSDARSQPVTEIQLFEFSIIARDAVWALTPDDRHLYGHTGFYSRDPENGLLTQFGVSGLVTKYARSSPDGAFVYDENGVFSRNAQTGELTSIQSVALAIGFAVGEDFIVTPGPTVTFHERDPNTGMVGTSYGIPVLPTAVHQLLASEDGDAVYGLDYLPNNNEDTLVVFDRDPGTGLFSVVQSFRPEAATTYLRRAAISPDGRHFYLNTRNDELLVYSRDALSGQLSPVQTVDFGGLVQPANNWDMVVSPDGRRLFIAATSSLASMLRNSVTGRVVFEGVGSSSSLPVLEGQVLVTSQGTHVISTGQLAMTVHEVAPLPTVPALAPLGLVAAGAALMAIGLHHERRSRRR